MKVVQLFIESIKLFNVIVHNELRKVGTIKIQVFRKKLRDKFRIAIFDNQFNLFRLKSDDLTDFNKNLCYLIQVLFFISDMFQLAMNVVFKFSLSTKKINKILNKLKVVMTIHFIWIFCEESKGLSAHEPIW